MPDLQRHIVHVVPFASRIGGYERQGLRLVDQMANLSGVRVTLITHADHARSLKARRRLTDDPPSRTGSIHGIRMGRLPTGSLRIDRWLDRAQVVHVHALDPLAGRVAERARIRRIPFVVKVATTGDVSLFADPTRQPIEAPVELTGPGDRRAWIEHQTRALQTAWRSLSDASAFLALNRDIAAELEAHEIPLSRIHLIPNGVPIPTVHAAFDPEGARAVSVGRIENRKRIDIMLDAFKCVRTRKPDATLTIVGDGPDAHRLQTGADVPGVTWLGEIDDPERILRDAADLFIFASEREGCPNALLEATAHGVAAIATDIPGVRDWFDDGANIRLVPPGSAPALADAWLALLNAPDDRHRLADAGRLHVTQTASLEIITTRLLDLYDRLPACGPGEKLTPALSLRSVQK